MVKRPIRHERYLLFAGDFYYPAGGFSDFIDSYKSIEEIKEDKLHDYDWYEIVDLKTYEIVKESRHHDDGT